MPVIDLFAGPGGLGEGFSTCSAGHCFDIRLSIEKDTFAHRTLELRSFYRLFREDAPEEYYRYLTRQISRDDLFKAFAAEAGRASRQAWRAELGSPSIRDSTVDERIRDALPVADSSPWVLIGGPPCQAYSTAGRARLKGISTERYEKDHRHYLYRQYLRILAVHRPHVFVMENVKGLLSAKIGDSHLISQILSDLRDPGNGSGTGSNRGYELYSVCQTEPRLNDDRGPVDFIVKSERFGIPQARHRLIIIGVRRDLRRTPGCLAPHESSVTMEEAVSDLPRLRSGISSGLDDSASWVELIRSALHSGWFQDGSIDTDVHRRIQEVASHPPDGLGRGGEYIEWHQKPTSFSSSLTDDRLLGFCNHSSRSHINGDIHRYLFASCFAREKGRSPLLREYPDQLLPNHRNVMEAINRSMFSDRFRVQLPGNPSTTVTSHIGRDGHYYIHYDPYQCRSLTVREAARLQTFPDNYFFEGPRTEQYKQVGNAVPVLLARQIAEVVANLVGRL